MRTIRQRRFGRGALRLRSPGARSLFIITLATAAVLTQSRRADADIVSWQLPGDGNWNVAANWSGSGVPSLNDDVFINNVSVSLAGGSNEAGTLTLTDTTLSNGPLTIAGATTTTGTSLFDTATVNSGGNIDVTTILRVKDTDLTASSIVVNGGSDLSIQGNTTLHVSSIVGVYSGVFARPNLFWEGGGPSSYALNSGQTISGQFERIGDLALINNGQVTLNNAGAITMNATGGNYTTTIGGGAANVNIINNTGTISGSNSAQIFLDVQTFNNNSGGVVSQDGRGLTIFNGPVPDEDSGANFNNNAGGTVSVTGGGTLALGSGIFTNNGAFNVDNLATTDSTLRGASAYNISGATATTGSTLFDTATVNASGGFDVATSLRVKDSSLTTSTINIEGGSDLSIQGSTVLNVSSIVGNGSNMIWEGGGPSSYSIGAGQTLSGQFSTIGYYALVNSSPVTLNNQGTIAMAQSGTLFTTELGNNTGLSVNTINNTGTISAGNGAQLTILAPTFNNNSGGMVSQDGRVLTVYGGANFNNNAGATLSITGGGILYMGSGTFTNNGALNVSNLVTANSTLTGGSAYNISGATTTTGTTLFDTTTVNAAGGIDVTTILRVKDTNLTTDTINIEGGSDLSIQGNSVLHVSSIVGNGSDMYWEGGGPSSYTIGAGTTISGRFGGLGNGALVDGGPVTLNNAGTIAINDTGSAYTTRIGAGGANYVNNLNNTGTIRAANSGNITIGAATFTNSGTLDAGPGTTITLQNGVTQTGGVTIVNGALNVGAGKQFVMEGGSLGGGGTVNGNVLNGDGIGGGTVSPGNSPGELTIAGNYTQGSLGSELTQLGGTGQGTTYDWLNVTGDGTSTGIATLDGALDVQLVNGFNPTVGEMFTFLTYASHTGEFATIDSENAGYTYGVLYNGANAELEVLTAGEEVTTPEPGAWAMLAGFLVAGIGIRGRRKRSGARMV